MEFLITNKLTEIEPLADKIADFCKRHHIGRDVLGDDILYDLRIALDEVISNTIKYGYEDSLAHEIRVRISIHREELQLEIEDDAKAFDPLNAPSPNLSVPTEEKTTGGLGIYLVRSLMDAVEYTRAGNKNILLLKKSLA